MPTSPIAPESIWDSVSPLSLPPKLTDPSVAASLSPTAVTTVDSIVNKWGLTRAQSCVLMGGINLSTYKRRLAKPEAARLCVDELTRASLIIGIYRALQTLYSGELADAWMTLENTNQLFAGSTPLEHTERFGIIGLAETRRLLDAYRGGR